jgi:hypothetical protein
MQEIKNTKDNMHPVSLREQVDTVLLITDRITAHEGRVVGSKTAHRKVQSCYGVKTVIYLRDKALMGDWGIRAASKTHGAMTALKDRAMIEGMAILFGKYRNLSCAVIIRNNEGIIRVLLLKQIKDNRSSMFINDTCDTARNHSYTPRLNKGI